MKKKLEEELEEWAHLAETYPDEILDEMAEVDVMPRLKRECILFYLAPHVVEALKRRAKEEKKSISFLVERWLTEKLFIEKSTHKHQV
ncbi:TPA: hypothetical protein EYP66_02705 [Candidatus Poribacteria bacterium]|nr:hypothetical protein [Candidatus Poribacteria bacterium]